MPFKQPPVWYPGDDLFTPLERRTGIPIGNLTSQFLSNLYLDDFDHYLKEQLRIPAYLRYVLATYKRLRLHPNKAHIFQTRQGVDVLGYIIFPHKRLLRNDNGHRFFRRLRTFAKASRSGKVHFLAFKPNIRSWIGHARHADTYKLRCKIFAQVILKGGSDE